jgi:AraC family transcriptional activator FtrA
VIAPHRDGGQAQFIPRPVLAEKDAIGDVFSWARQHLEQDLSIASLAARVRMSRRTFIRRFEEATGVSPGKWVLDARLAGARQLLESSNMSIERIAIAVGFGSADALRHHFRSRIRTSPTRYRFSFRG